MRQWPWITLVAALLVAVSPLGQSVFDGAFVSGEQLSRSIAQFLLTIGLAIFIGLGFIEWLIKWYVRRRRAAQALIVTTADSRTES